MAGDAGTQEDEFEEVIAELNNVCTTGFGLAFCLAHRYEKDVIRALERQVECYHALVMKLVEIYRNKRR